MKFCVLRHGLCCQLKQQLAGVARASQSSCTKRYSLGIDSVSTWRRLCSRHRAAVPGLSKPCHDSRDRPRAGVARASQSPCAPRLTVITEKGATLELVVRELLTVDSPPGDWVKEEEEGINGAAFEPNLAPISAVMLHAFDRSFKDPSKAIIETTRSVMGEMDATDAASETTYGFCKCQPKKNNSAQDGVKEQIDTKNNSQTKAVQNEHQTTLQDH